MVDGLEASLAVYHGAGDILMVSFGNPLLKVTVKGQNQTAIRISLATY